MPAEASQVHANLGTSDQDTVKAHNKVLEGIDQKATSSADPHIPKSTWGTAPSTPSKSVHESASSPNFASPSSSDEDLVGLQDSPTPHPAKSRSGAEHLPIRKSIVFLALSYLSILSLFPFVSIEPQLQPLTSRSKTLSKSVSQPDSRCLYGGGRIERVSTLMRLIEFTNTSPRLRLKCNS